MSDECSIDNSDSKTGLRIGAVFIILITSLAGSVAPVILRSASFIPRPIFEFAKFFGSGVIIATAFIHLLAPAFDELGSPCLAGVWTEYDWAPAIAMAAVYTIFFAEVAAYRIGTAKLMRLGVTYSAHNEDDTDAHAHSHADSDRAPLDVDISAPEAPLHVHPTHVEPDTESSSPTRNEKKRDEEAIIGQVPTNELSHEAEGAAQLIAVAVLEFGIILHSVIIGLTLGVTDDFITLFIVIIFHQMFEGLGLGSRLSGLNLPPRLWWSRYLAAFCYSICTPVGIAAGIGARSSYNGNGVTANIVSGVLDACSAGVLLYTGLVELMAHEILLNPRMMKSKNGKLTYIFGCMLVGSGLMALLGRWA